MQNDPSIPHTPSYSTVLPCGCLVMYDCADDAQRSRQSSKQRSARRRSCGDFSGGYQASNNYQNQPDISSQQDASYPQTQSAGVLKQKTGPQQTTSRCQSQNCMEARNTTEVQASQYDMVSKTKSAYAMPPSEFKNTQYNSKDISTKATQHGVVPLSQREGQVNGENAQKNTGAARNVHDPRVPQTTSGDKEEFTKESSGYGGDSNQGNCFENLSVSFDWCDWEKWYKIIQRINGELSSVQNQSDQRCGPDGANVEELQNGPKAQVPNQQNAQSQANQNVCPPGQMPVQQNIPYGQQGPTMHPSQNGCPSTYQAPFQQQGPMQPNQNGCPSTYQNHFQQQGPVQQNCCNCPCTRSQQGGMQQYEIPSAQIPFQQEMCTSTQATIYQKPNVCSSFTQVPTQQPTCASTQSVSLQTNQNVCTMSQTPVQQVCTATQATMRQNQIVCGQRMNQQQVFTPTQAAMQQNSNVCSSFTQIPTHQQQVSASTQAAPLQLNQNACTSAQSPVQQNVCTQTIAKTQPNQCVSPSTQQQPIPNVCPPGQMPVQQNVCVTTQAPMPNVCPQQSVCAPTQAPIPNVCPSACQIPVQENVCVPTQAPMRQVSNVCPSVHQIPVQENVCVPTQAPMRQVSNVCPSVHQIPVQENVCVPTQAPNVCPPGQMPVQQTVCVPIAGPQFLEGPSQVVEAPCEVKRKKRKCCKGDKKRDKKEEIQEEKTREPSEARNAKRSSLPPEQLNFSRFPTVQLNFVDYFLKSEGGVSSVLTLAEIKLEYEKKCKSLLATLPAHKRKEAEEFFNRIIEAIQVKVPESNHTEIKHYNLMKYLHPIVGSLHLRAHDQVHVINKYHAYILSVVNFMEERLRERQPVNPDAIIDVETHLLAGIMSRFYPLFIKIKENATKPPSGGHSVSSDEYIRQLRKLILAIYVEIICIGVTFDNTVTSLNYLPSVEIQEKYRQQMATRKKHARHSVTWAARCITTVLLYHHIQTGIM